MSSLSSPDAALRASGSRTDLYYVLSAGLLWGTGGLAGSLLGQVAALSPLAVATYRLAGGGLTVLAVLAVTGRLPRLRRAGWLRVLSVGVLTATYQVCYFAAVAMTSLAVATVIAIGAAPVLVLTAEAVGERRRPGSASLVAIGLALLGLALLLGTSGHPLTRAGGGSLALGVLLALGAAAGFGALALIGRRPVPGLDGPATIGVGFTAGGVLLAVAALVVGALTGGHGFGGHGFGGLEFAPTAASVGLLVYLGWVPTALAYGLFFVGLRGVSASSAAVVAVLEPVTATVLGVLVLGQRLGLGGMVGAGLLCAAAVVAGVGGSTSRPVTEAGLS
ncbi:EamA family transporter [Pseudonocardia sp. Cha107L01]|uniref:EamA family transporter n=1 Tax=Pseudonocardia sp. Cha107L01 TaxID=3457576 RepID=UPI00403E6BB4